MTTKWSAFAAGSAISGTDVSVGLQSSTNVQWTWSQALTYIGAGTVALTNKTFNTAASGNVFQINGTGITAVTGSGAVALATSPVFVTPTLGVAGSTAITAGTISAALTTLTGSGDGYRTNATNVTLFAGESTSASSSTAGGVVGVYCNDGAAMASGDRLGGFRMGGSSSAAALRNSAGVFAFADQTWVDASAYGSRLEFQNTTNSATALSTKAILSNAGIFALGATLANTVPALKPSSAVLQARLADDSAFAQVQGKLTTDANATTGLGAGVLAALTNASITITDASGQVYRVPCVI